MGYLHLLRSQHAFRRLWFGQIVSELGDWLQLIALLSLFPSHGEAAASLSGIFIVRAIPSVLFVPVVGVIADRFPRGRVMVACDLARALVVLGYLAVRGPEDAGWIYALMFAQETLTCLFEPARAAAVPQIVAPEALFAANALGGITWSAVLALGGALGGLLAGALGARAAFILNALTFLASAALIAGVHVPPVTRSAASAEAHARDRFGLFAVREGFSYLRGHRPAAMVTVTKALWGLSGGVVVLFSIYAGSVFAGRGVDVARTTGLLYAGRGTGAFIGPLIAQRVFGSSSEGLRRSIQAGFPLAAAAIAAFAFAPSATLGTLLLICAHAGGSTCWVSSTQLLQLAVPNELLGRACAVELAAFTFAFSLSSAFTGAALGRGLLDLRELTLVLAAAAMLSAIVWGVAMGRLGPGLDAATTRKRADAPAGI